MSYTLTFPETLRATIVLPASKSLSARALIISKLAGAGSVENLSDCDDTYTMRRALAEDHAVVDIMAAGTAMRFLTAYFSATEGEHVITGTTRMKQRPIGILVEALRSLGADIEYTENEGYPPLRIKGKKLSGGEVTLPADVSSQYISALLMIGPALEEGLTLQLVGEVASRPYIDMTLSLMRKFGAEADWTAENAICVKPQPYKADTTFSVEPDWSAASYWYEMVALSSDTEACVALPGLQENSVQGDSCVAQLFEHLGVATRYDADGISIYKKKLGTATPRLEIDFTAMPDLAQTLVVACAVSGKAFHFEGLQSLKIKETDRILALQTELKKLGLQIACTHHSMTFEGCQCSEEDTPATINTYDDHRMAMAFAPGAMLYKNITIAHPEVVSKSYPSFWEDLRSIGVEIADSRKETKE